MNVRHKHNGGTGISNFSTEERHIYEQAIQESGDKFLCIGRPIGGHKGYLALHDKSPTTRDLAFFWRILDKIEAEITKPRIGNHKSPFGIGA